jgi:hypothetical protein
MSIWRFLRTVLPLRKHFPELPGAKPMRSARGSTVKSAANWFDNCLVTISCRFDRFPLDALECRVIENLGLGKYAS